MPHLLSHIPSSIFYGSIFLEFPRIATYTLSLPDFVPYAFKLYLRKVAKGGERNKIG